MRITKCVIWMGMMMMAGASYGQVVINELMQSNVDCIMDDNNEFPDSWVELYNSGETTVSLKDYRLGVTADPSQAWQLPNTSLKAHQYYLVYCDKEGKDRHTDFRLESGNGSSVYLFRQGQVADAVTSLAKQPAPNVAYGRKHDGEDIWGYQYTPTPQAKNCGQICTEVLGEPIFSEVGRVTTGNDKIVLKLSIPEGSPEGTVIRMTVDGSEPTRASAEYKTAMTISTTRTVRAKLFCDGYLSPRSTTHSYIFFPRQLTLPVVSLVTNDSYFFDNKIGIYVNGNYSSTLKNYEYNWRRPVNIEFFTGEEEVSALNQLCETRVQGGASRGCSLRSLIVYANKRFGKKRLKYEFFPDQRPGRDEFKSIILRNAGNDFDYLYMRDAIIQRTMAKHTDLDWQAWRPAIVYINGTYKGILNLRERSTDDNIYTNYDGLEDIDMLENWGELKAGDKENWHAFEAFYAEHGHTLEEYAQWIDWKEFINLMLMNLYYNNQDFPGNNIVMWRKRSDDGRWRFVAKDTDFGIGLYGTSPSYNTIKWIYDPNYDSDRAWANHYEHTRLFRRMMEDEDFKREFIDRAAIYMGDFMNSRGTREIWDDMYEQIKTEYPNHRRLINQWWPNYDTELTTARNWMEQRTDYFYTQLKVYYGLGKAVPLIINNHLDDDQLADVNIEMNGVRLSQGKFDGRFFANRNMKLSSTPVNGKSVTGWKVIKMTSNGTTTTTLSGQEYEFDMPDCTRLIIQAQIGIDTGVSTQDSPQWTWRQDGRRVDFVGLAAGSPVYVYNTQGVCLYHTIAHDDMTTLQLTHSGVYIVKADRQVIKLKIE